MTERSHSSARNLHTSRSIRHTDRHLREKMENPYWIPKKNSDLFQVKQIFKAEKEIKKNLSISKIKRNMILNKLHTNQLETNFSFLKENYLITDPTITDRIQTTAREDDPKSLLLKTKLETERTIVNPTIQIDEISEEKKKKQFEEEQEQKNNSKKMEKKIKDIKKKKFEGVREFINKTREIVLTKYGMRIRKERILRVEETYRNDVESYRDTVSDMIRAKKKFETEFLVKFDLYMKHLSQKKEKERNDLSKLEDLKANLEADLKQLENKKQKNKEKLDLFKDYRIFQIYVKEGINFANLVPSQEKKNNGATFLTQTKNVTFHKKRLTKKNSLLTSNVSELSDASMSSVLYPNQFETSITNDKINRYNGCKIIFDKPSDLRDKLKILEKSNLEKLDEYIDLTSRLNMAQREYINMQDEDISDNTLINDINDKIIQLEEIKIKERKLNEEKKSLNKSTYSNNSLAKNKILKTKLFAKINNIYQNLPLYLKEREWKKYLGNTAVSKNENELEMLRVLERTFDFLNLKYNEFCLNMSEELKNFEKEIEIDRKKKITQDQKIQKEKKIRNLEIAIFERQNKIYAIPKRRIANDRNKPLKKEKIEIKELKTEDNINLYELLAFDGDDNFKMNV